MGVSARRRSWPDHLLKERSKIRYFLFPLSTVARQPVVPHAHKHTARRNATMSRLDSPRHGMGQQQLWFSC